MRFINRYFGGSSRLRKAQAALDVGELLDGLSLLRSQSHGSIAVALMDAEKCVLAGDIAAGVDRLLPENPSPAKRAAFRALGDAALKPGWQDALHWLPPSLFHFTELSNLPEIFSSGEILSRFQLEMRGIEPPAPGGDAVSWMRDRKQGMLDFVHLSMVTPHPMLFSAAKRIRRPVYFALVPTLALRKETRYSDRNATDMGAVIYESLLHYKGIVHRALAGLHPAENKAAVQAEVLVHQRIRLDPYIVQKVIFRSKFEMESALGACNSEEWYAKKFIVDEGVFS